MVGPERTRLCVGSTERVPLGPCKGRALSVWGGLLWLPGFPAHSWATQGQLFTETWSLGPHTWLWHLPRRKRAASLPPDSGQIPQIRSLLGHETRVMRLLMAAAAPGEEVPCERRPPPGGRDGGLRVGYQRGLWGDARQAGAGLGAGE